MQAERDGDQQMSEEDDQSDEEARQIQHEQH